MMRSVMLLFVAGLLVGSSVFALFSSSGSAYRSNENAETDHFDRDTPRPEAHANLRFDEQQRQAVRTYYWQELQSGTCPPGLVHAQSACSSTSRDRKWSIGAPLPQDAVAYEVSPDVVYGLPLLLPDARYVRVDMAILLVRSAGGLVLDAVDTATDL